MKHFSLLFALILFARTPAKSEEGMWPFNNLPVNQIAKLYGFQITPEWSASLMKSSVRISYGGSGSFVSSQGLVLTNHHVASSAIDALGKKDGVDYFSNGFFAKTLDQERNPENGLEVEQLVEINDMTAEVNHAVTPGMSPEKASEAKQSAIAAITAKAEKESGFKCQMITLYQGGQYHLYKFKVYTDVRLVFAPEQSIAFFGGDTDNFEFPRYNLDAAIFRVYENGKPANIQNFLKMPKRPLEVNQLVFISGNPGSTQRGITVRSLLFQRDIEIPFRLKILYQREVTLTAFAKRNAENEKAVHAELFSIQNSRKVFSARLKALQDPQFVGEFADKETDFISKISDKPELKDAIGAFEAIGDARIHFASFFELYNYLEGAVGFNSDLFQAARVLIRAAEERQKPDGERLEEYSNSKLKSLELRLFAPSPINDEAEILKLSESLSALIQFGNTAPPNSEIRNSLGFLMRGKDPTERARQLVQAAYKLKDPAERKRLYQMTPRELRFEANRNIMLGLAWFVDDLSRQVRKKFEVEVREVERTAYAKIATARFAIYGDSIYPDATFSPRVSYGLVAGWKEGVGTEPGWKKAGVVIPAFTKIGGAFDREMAQGGRGDFQLPQSWHLAKDSGALNLDQPFNFSSSVDSIGGNSGSPVVNTALECVGLLFDGTKGSLPGNFSYKPQMNRSVSVDTGAILHALKNVYGMKHIANSLGK